jgi:AcrR family transcriptional regulator
VRFDFAPITLRSPPDRDEIGPIKAEIAAIMTEIVAIAGVIRRKSVVIAPRSMLYAPGSNRIGPISSFTRRDRRPRAASRRLDRGHHRVARGCQYVIGRLVQAPRPGRRSADVTRRRLIESAVEILRRDGIAAATTGRIAGAAGLKQPTFYVHFTDRDEVFEAAAAEIGQRMLQNLQRQQKKFDAADVKASLRTMYEAIVASFLSEPELTRIFLRHRMDDGTVLGRVFGHQVQQARAAILESLPVYGVATPSSAAATYVEIIVSAVLGVLEALVEGRLRDRDVAVDAIAGVTEGVLRSHHGNRR